MIPALISPFPVLCTLTHTDEISYSNQFQVCFLNRGFSVAAQMYLQYLILVVLQLMKYIIYNGSISLNSV